MPNVPLVQRAFELASSGEFSSTKEIRAKLIAEDYLDVDEHLAAPSFSRQLRSLCARARSEQADT